MIDPADFDALARVAMAQAEHLLERLVGGKRTGHEWTAARTRDGGPGDSWSFNLDTGVWGHFASGSKGTDIISYLAGIWHLNQGPAADRLAAELGWSPGTPQPAILPRVTRPDPETCDRIPFDAPPIVPHPTHGPPSAIYEYGDLFRVARFDYVDAAGHPAKEFRQYTWRRGKWVAQGWPGTRPLYRLPELLQRPDAPVLVVEGEKCADAAPRGFPGHVVVTWAGGAAAIDRTDWAPLHGRDVLIWPDADEPGRKAAAWLAARLQGNAASVRVVNPNGADPGWDVADAIRDGWDAGTIGEWVAEHVAQDAAPNEQGPINSKAPPSVPRVAGDDSGSAPVRWDEMGLDCNQNRIPFPTLANASKILQLYRNFKGHIWFDEFRQEVYHTLRGETPEPWTDRDTRAVTVAIQQQLRLHKFTETIIYAGILHAAETHARNPLTDWLDSLTWDCDSRLDTWLLDCAGVELTEYSRAIARNWLIGMVARAYQPGCKMDNIPVLEGQSGLNKSTFLEVLGGEWYEALPMDFGTKDFLHALQGVWLAEIPDMTGFDRADHSRVISLLSVPRDKFRKSYARNPERFRRTTVFAATSEDEDYLIDRRGKRRFWPLRVTAIDLARLRAQRAQLFAEAVACYRAREHWYDMPAGTTEEQNARLRDDTWVKLIMTYIRDRAEQLRRTGRPVRIEMVEVLSDALSLPPDKQTPGASRRAGNVLRSNDWICKHTTDGNYWRPVERKSLEDAQDDQGE